MGDIETATRVPENDASEQNAHSSSAGLSEHCVTDRPTREH
jgi:hypothetical protein